MTDQLTTSGLIRPLDPSAGTVPGRAHAERIIVRPYPKIIVFYPMMLAAFLCAALSACFSRNPAAQEHIATVFLILLAINAVILSFEFPRMTALFVGTLLVLIVVVLLWFRLYIWILSAAANMHWVANGHFYLAFGMTMLGIYGLVWVVTRFDYWEITPNELLHHHGPFADMQRYPAPSLRLDKEIPDICEYFLLCGGRLVLHPTSERQAIVLEIVLNVKQVERSIQHLLAAMEVRVDSDLDGGDQPRRTTSPANVLRQRRPTC